MFAHTALKVKQIKSVHTSCHISMQGKWIVLVTFNLLYNKLILITSYIKSAKSKTVNTLGYLVYVVYYTCYGKLELSDTVHTCPSHVEQNISRTEITLLGGLGNQHT